MNPVESVLAGMAARRRMQREDEDAEDRKRQREDEQEDRTNRRADRQFTMSERARTLKLRDDLGAAAAPVAVEQRDQAGPVDPASEVAAAAQPLAPVPTVQGRGFETTDAASRAAAELNTPQAVAARQAQVLSAAGDAVGAQQVRTGSMQEQSARFKLNADERADLDARFNADLQSRVNSWDTLEQFMSSSASDGAGGAVKYKLGVSADGKKRIVSVVTPDGTLKDTGQSFDNTADGLQTSIGELSKMPVSAKLAHLHQKAVEARQAAAQESTEKYQAGMLQATQDRTAAGIELAQARADAARARAAGGAGGAALAQQGAATVAWDDKADERLFAHYGTEDPTTGVKSRDGFGVDFAKQVALAISARNGGDTLRAVGQAIDIDAKLKGRAAAAVAASGGKLTPERAIRAERMNFLNAGAASATSTSAAAAAIPVDPRGPQAPAKTPEAPGMLSRAAAAVKGALADGAETGKQMEAIRARVMQAGNGGPPLTPAERAQAKKYGITPTV